MPALTPSSNLFLHIFKPADLSGFHSKAKFSEIAVDKRPQIHRFLYPAPTGLGFYLCAWNFERNEDGMKWSTMFPDSWAATKVETAVYAAIEYWNNLGASGTDNIDRVKKLVELYRVGWMGNAKVDGKTIVIGGMSGDNKVQSAFPMMGANANFPRVTTATSIYPPPEPGKQRRIR